MEVEMDVSRVSNHHHQQELSSQTLESMLQVCTKAQEDKKPRPPEEALKCPRCDSGNTKFCYYNNYSLTQPRYFCKSCRRYWTKGGTLRNVPVGGGCRKNKRSSSSSSTSSSYATSSYATPSNSSSSSKIRGPHIPHDHLVQQHPLSFVTPCSNNPLLAGVPQLPYDSTTDLSLAFARLQREANGSMGYDHFDHNVDHLGFGSFLETQTNPNRFHNNLMYNNMGGNVGHQQMLNHHPLFNDHQEQDRLTCSAATSAPATPVKQEACNMVRPSEVGLWGFPCLMGAGGAEPGTMVHEVESGRSMIGGWNGIGSTNWHGLINSALM